MRKLKTDGAGNALPAVYCVDCYCTDVKPRRQKDSRLKYYCPNCRGIRKVGCVGNRGRGEAS